MSHKCPRCGFKMVMSTRPPQAETQKLYPKAGMLWAMEDDEMLEQLVKEGKSRIAMTRALGRQIGGIMQRIEKLGLRYAEAIAQADADGVVLPAPIPDDLKPL